MAEAEEHHGAPARPAALIRLRHADQIVALDRFMADIIAGKGIDRRKIAVLPPWSHDGQVR
jgi:hypothetical protein